MQLKKPELIRIALVDDDEAFANSLKIQALDFGLEITWFQTWAGSKEAIRDRRFELVILDAKGQRDLHTPKGDIQHLHQARTDLALWRGQNIHIPYVIFTGNAEDATASLENEKRYIKFSDEEEMLTEIMHMVDRSNEQAVRNRYADVLEVLRLPHFASEAEGLFIEALLFVEHGDRSGRDRLFMNPLRQVLEHLFIAANSLGFIPDDLIKPFINQRLSALFLSGTRVDFPSRSTPKKRFWSEQPLLPKLLGQALENVINVTNWGSHAISSGSTVEDTNFLADNEEAFRDHGGSPFLLSTVVFQLMDILVFFKRFTDDHPDPKANRTWLHEEAVGSDGVPVLDGDTKELRRVVVKKRNDNTYAHAGDAYINKDLIKLHRLVDGDLVSGQVKQVVLNGQTKLEFTTITKH